MIAVIGFAVARCIFCTPCRRRRMPRRWRSAYLRIIFLGIPAIFLLAFMMMALRGAGDSRTPFFFMLISAVSGRRAEPAADPRRWAHARHGDRRFRRRDQHCAMAQPAFWLVGWMYWRKSMLVHRRGDLKYFKIDPAILRSLLVKGVPIGAAGGRDLHLDDPDDQPGGSLTARSPLRPMAPAFQLWSYIQMPAFAVGTAVSSMAAQNIGAGRWDRVNQIVLVGHRLCGAADRRRIGGCGNAFG